MQQVKSDSDLPIVTAVVPCHNHEAWVADAVMSIVNQRYPKGNLRIMVVDDGSRDNSAAAVPFENVGSDIAHANGITQRCGHIQEIPVILMMRPEPGGPSVARNLGIEAGWEGTDVFAFLDSDDMYHPDKVSRSIEKLLRSPKIGAVYSDYETLGPNGRIREFKEPFEQERLLQECIVNCDSLVTKQALDECGRFDEEMRVCEDYDLWMRISEKFVITHIPEALVTIRVGDHSSTAKVQSEVWQQNWRRVMSKAQQRRSQHAV